MDQDFPQSTTKYSKSKGNPMEQYDYVKLKNVPSFSKLNKQVQQVVHACSWWELHGVDWLHILGALALVPGAILLLREDNTLGLLGQALGVFILGCGHGIWASKSGHIASHGGLARSPKWNMFWMAVFVEFCGAFSHTVGYVEHVQGHHPHTNIIGLGDSSTWKAPFVPCYLYMFVTPLLLPLLTPAVSMWHLLGNWTEMGKFLVVASAGVVFEVLLLVYVSELSVLQALACIYMIRAVMGIPYIHINIFQHIGLPMYSQDNRPVRIYQMATGVLNLSRNRLLDIVFGHSFVNCHVEHHLFPKLSDNMCLKIKPLVKSYLLENGLPYNEDSYTTMLDTFVKKYDELMVNAPPVTHFVGLQ